MDPDDEKGEEGMEYQDELEEEFREEIETARHRDRHGTESHKQASYRPFTYQDRYQPTQVSTRFRKQRHQ